MEKKFNPAQVREIEIGKYLKLDTSIYEDVSFDWEKMQELRITLLEKTFHPKMLDKSFCDLKVKLLGIYNKVIGLKGDDDIAFTYDLDTLMKYIDTCKSIKSAVIRFYSKKRQSKK